MAPDDDAAGTSAIDWHIRLRDGDAAVWAAFVVWLEADRAHAAAYDAIDAADASVMPLLPPVVTPLPGRARSRHRLAWGGVIAASLVAAVAVGPRLASPRYDIATGPGETRVIALDAATSVTLNGSTRLTLDRRDPRFASLDTGEALFRVRHDPAAPFALDLGPTRIEDVGTVFNVVRHRGEIRVAVAEGAVVYHPGGGGVAVHAGQALVDPPGAGAVTVSSADAAAVGGWRSGRLSYAGETLARVVADVERSIGVRIGVAPLLAARRFSGTLIVDRTGAAQLPRLAQELQVDLHRDRGDWTMTPDDD